MRRTLSAVSFVITLLLPPVVSPSDLRISLRLDSYAERAAAGKPLPLHSIPSEEWWERYESESIVYVPGEVAHITAKISGEGGAIEGKIVLSHLLSGEKRTLHRGPLGPGIYGPYEIPIDSEFEVYQLAAEVGGKTVVKSFYGIVPWRGMSDFATAVSPHRLSLDYGESTPWDIAVKQGFVPRSAADLKWASASYTGESGPAATERWLWTQYACGLVEPEDDRGGLLWGDYNPWAGLLASSASRRAHIPAAHTDGMLPNETYFRERMQPLLRIWADSVSENLAGEPLTISLGEGWGLGGQLGRRCPPEILRFFVPWMKELFGIELEAETFEKLIRKCKEYPRHLEYFVARNTSFRSLELTCEAVRDMVAGSAAWDRTWKSNRELIRLPEAAEFCGILSRYMSAMTGDDRSAFHDTNGNPLPHSLSAMVSKALDPTQRYCMGWSGCGMNVPGGQIERWYLDFGWTVAYDAEGRLQHVITHSPPRGPEGIWQSLIGGSSDADDAIRVYDRCFQLIEAIGVEKPIGPVFVCKDWTFSDEKSGRAFRSDLFEDFLLSLRRHKVPISCAVHVDNESKLPEDLPRVYAPRMDGRGKIRIALRSGGVEQEFTCEPSGIAESVVGELAAAVNAAGGNPLLFPEGTSIEGYGFEARGMRFVIAEEMGNKKETGEIRVRVGGGQWKVIDLLVGREVGSRQEEGCIVFEASLEAGSARLYCVFQRKEE